VELACDSMATEGMARAERTAYGETLLAAVQAKSAPVPMTTSFGSTAERLKRRIANVLGGKKKRGLWLAALAVAVVAASALLIAWQNGTDAKTKDTDVWLTMEDYALDRTNAVRESGVALFPQSGGAAVAAVSDVRETELECAAVLDGVFPELDGRPELWRYDYAVRFADEESLPLTDQEDWYSMDGGWYGRMEIDVLVVLADADGYRILHTGTWEMVKDYRDKSGDSGDAYYREALYDWCADYLALDETAYPRYLRRVTLTYTDGTGSAVRETAALRRCEGDGWFVYAPADWTFTPQWLEWRTPYGTEGEAYFEVTRADGSMENIKAYYASIGAWRFETDLSAPLDYYYNVGGGYDAAYGYAHEELYFVPIDDDHCYVLSCYSVNGVTSAEDKALLRAALTSFTPDESLRWTPEQRFQYEIECLEHDTGVELTLLSGAGELGSCRNDFAISGLCPLGQYTYTPWEDAVYAGGDKAIRLTVSDGCYLEVYEDSNLISYCRRDGSLLGRYMASGAGLGDGSIVPVEGTSLYGVVREWYDVLELADVRRAPVIFIADEGQSWQEAAQSWADTYWSALTRVSEDNVYHCSFVRAKAYSFLSDDDNEQMRRLGKLGEGEYGFYMNGYFVPTHPEELTVRYDENVMQPVEAGNGLPAGTYTMFYRCRLIAADGGWYGEILGNGSW